MAIRNNPFKPFIKKIPAPLRNFYFLTLVLFFGWLIFFDKHDVLTQGRLQQSINKLETDRLYYKDRIDQVEEDRLDIEINKEKFAREHYYMKKDDEDVFIIVEEEQE